MPDRLAQLGGDLLKLLKKYKPKEAVVEEIFFGANVATAMLTAQARGVLIYVLRNQDVAIHTLTPLQIKSRLAGFGRASKQQIQALVKSRLKLSSVPQPDDAADALAAALCRVDNPYEITTISA